MPSRAHATTLLKAWALLLVLGALPGCASWWRGDFQDPQVHLLRADVVKARLLEQEFLLRFRIDNPNDYALPVRGFDYRLYLGEILLAEGESSDWFNVPAGGSHAFDVPVRTNLWRHVKNVMRMLEDPEQPVRYRLVGEVKTGLLFGRDVHVARNGEIIPGNYLPE